MIHARIERGKAVPIWAALGAPLIGVPLMVALLALSAPADRVPSGEPQADMETAQMGVCTVDQAVDLHTDGLEQQLQSS
jgi:hypothetical protein